MTEKQQAMIDFAEYAIRALENEEDWSAETIDDIANTAINLDLAYTNDDGYFRGLI